MASGALFGVFFMGSAFGEAWHGVLRDPWGRTANLAYVIGVVWRDLFGIVMPGEPTADIPTWAAALALAVDLRAVRLAPGPSAAGARGRVVSEEPRIVFEDVSKFYGEVLGVNNVTLSLPPGITSLVGPNGSGKTTLMNLMTGLIRPSRGRISVAGMSPDDPEVFGRRVGYCSQFDAFPDGVTGRAFLRGWLRLPAWAARARSARRRDASSAWG